MTGYALVDPLERRRITHAPTSCLHVCTISSFLLTLGVVIAPNDTGFVREAHAQAALLGVIVNCVTPDSECRKIAAFACQQFQQMAGRPCVRSNGISVWYDYTHKNEDDDSEPEYALTSWVGSNDDRIREVTQDDSESELFVDIGDETARQDAWIRRSYGR